MKTRKKSLIALALFAIVGTSTYTGYSAYQRATMTDAQRLTLENIEALTAVPDAEDETNLIGYIDTTVTITNIYGVPTTISCCLKVDDMSCSCPSLYGCTTQNN